MKRPEGFDPPASQPQLPAKSGKPGSSTPSPRAPKAEKSQRQSQRPPGVPTGPGRAAKPERSPRSEQSPKQEKSPKPKRSERVTVETTEDAPPTRAELRKTARARRRYERKEVRRFTRRTRSRRIAWLSALGVTVVLILLVVVAVFSPLLALKTIRVEGTSVVSAAEVQNALKNQLDTPLALVDSAAIKRELARFPLIQSYVTESVPPNTLIVHVVERAPVAVVASGAGFTTVDPAGVVISKSDARPPKLPLVDVGAAGVKSKAFSAAVEVLLALPKSVLAQVDTVTAQTKDDVTLLLGGVGQKVIWGSAEHSEAKARALAGLIKNTSQSAAIEYDVSAPNAAVVRPS